MLAGRGAITLGSGASGGDQLFETGAELGSNGVFAGWGLGLGGRKVEWGEANWGAAGAFTHCNWSLLTWGENLYLGEGVKEGEKRGGR